MAVECVEGQGRGSDGPAQDRGVQHVGQDAGRGEEFTAECGLGATCAVEWDVHSAREPTLGIPRAFTMTQKDQGAHRGSLSEDL